MPAAVGASILVVAVAVAVAADAQAVAAQPGPPAQPGSGAEAVPETTPPPASPAPGRSALRPSGGVSAGLGLIDASCESCPGSVSAGFGGQVGARIGDRLFLGVGFAVATGSNGTTTGFFGDRRDEVMFALAAVTRVHATPSIWWGGGLGLASYRPPDRDSARGPLLLANAGLDIVRLEVSGVRIALELQLRGTAARAEGHTVTTGALLFGGTVTQLAAPAAAASR